MVERYRRSWNRLLGRPMVGVADTRGSRDSFVATSPSSSFVYLLTASHAVHLAGGLLALTYAVIAPFLGKTLESRRILLDVTAWYWHFMAVLWIYIFALLELAR